MAGLTSCENFLKGADVRKDLAEAIEVANSQAVTFNVVIEKGSGTVNLTQIRGKKKDTFELIFEPADDWKFITWEVTDKETGEVVPDIIKFNPVDKPQTKCTIQNPKEGLQIHAKCIQIPTIIDIEPKGISFVNTPIVVKFNMSIEEQTLFNPDNINISCNGEKLNYSDYYEFPEFNTDKNQLTFIPKSDLNVKEHVLLCHYMAQNNIGVANVQVTFDSSIVIASGEELLPISNPAFLVNFDQTIEKTIPVKKQLFVTRVGEGDNAVTLQNAESFDNNMKFHYRFDDIGDWDISQVKQNACNGTIYIYGRYVDVDSGIKSVVVRETRTNDILGRNRNDFAQKEYTKDDTDYAVFITENGETRFLIKHEMSVENGAVTLELGVYDMCMNACFDIYKIIKNNTGIVPSPFFKNNSNYNNNMSDTWIDFNGYQSGLQSYLKDIGTNIYDKDWDDSEGGDRKLYYPQVYATDMFTVKFEYKDSKNYPQSSVIENWEDYGDFVGSAVLKDLGMIPGSSIKLVAQDFMNNRYEKDIWVFPPTDTKILMDITKHSEQNYADVIFYNDEGKEVSPVLIRTDNNGAKTCSYEKKIEPGYTYQLMLNGVILNNTFSYETPVAQTVSKVEIKSVDISKDCEDGYLKATVNLDNNVWENNYDMIYLDYYKDSYNERKIVPFIRGCTQASFDFKNSNIYSNHDSYRTVDVYGIKDNKISEPNHYTIPKKTVNETDYDNTRPYFYGGKMDGENCYISIYDNESGIAAGATAIVINKNYGLDYDKIEKYYLDEYNTFAIPVNKLYPSSTVPSELYIIAYDKAGNPVKASFIEDVNINVINVAIFQRTVKILSKENDGSLIIATDNPGGDFLNYVFKKAGDAHPNASQNVGFEHKFSSNSSKSAQYVPQSSSMHQYKITENQLEENTFNKIVLLTTNGDSEGFTNPIYFYNGTSSSKEYDYLMPNGRGNTSFVVGSKKPVFVQTVITPVHKDICSDWDHYEWEYYKEELNQQILELDEAENAMVYYVPMGEIPDGYSYIVIAHYSDNHVVMSDVMVR